MTSYTDSYAFPGSCFLRFVFFHSLYDIYNAVLKCFIVSREIVIESLFGFEDFYGCLLLLLY